MTTTKTGEMKETKYQVNIDRTRKSYAPGDLMFVSDKKTGKIYIGRVSLVDNATNPPEISVLFSPNTDY